MSKSKILILDDEQSCINLHKEKLEKEGFECLEAQTGQRAIDLATTEDPCRFIKVALIDELLYKDGDSDGQKQKRQGKDVIKEIGRSRPDIRFIKITGKAEIEAERKIQTYEASNPDIDSKKMRKEYRRILREEQKKLQQSNIEKIIPKDEIEADPDKAYEPLIELLKKLIPPDAEVIYDYLLNDKNDFKIFFIGSEKSATVLADKATAKNEILHREIDDISGTETAKNNRNELVEKRMIDIDLSSWGKDLYLRYPNDLVLYFVNAESNWRDEDKTYCLRLYEISRSNFIIVISGIERVRAGQRQQIEDKILNELDVRIISISAQDKPSIDSLRNNVRKKLDYMKKVSEHRLKDKENKEACLGIIKQTKKKVFKLGASFRGADKDEFEKEVENMVARIYSVCKYGQEKLNSNDNEAKDIAREFYNSFKERGWLIQLLPENSIIIPQIVTVAFVIAVLIHFTDKYLEKLSIPNIDPNVGSMFCKLKVCEWMESLSPVYILIASVLSILFLFVLQMLIPAFLRGSNLTERPVPQIVLSIVVVGFIFIISDELIDYLKRKLLNDFEVDLDFVSILILLFVTLWTLAIPLILGKTFESHARRVGNKAMSYFSLEDQEDERVSLKRIRNLFSRKP